MTDASAESTESKLRASLAQVLGVSVESVPGEAVLAELLPEAQRRELWRRWEQICPVQLPALDHPMNTKLGWFGGGFLGALFVLAFLRTLGVHVPGSTMVGGIAGLLLGAVGLRWFAPAAVSFPPGVRTVADLAARMEARAR